MKKILLMADTVGVQNYLFGSNRLPENIGGSYLVATSTEDWVENSIKDLRPGCARLLYAGGGNFAIIFDDFDILRSFVRQLSRIVLENAPSLHLLFEHEIFEWDSKGELQRAVEILRNRLNRPDRTWRQTAPLMGSGVTVMCRSTALPATEVAIDNDKFYPVSAEVYAKLRVALPPDGDSRQLTEAEDRFNKMGLIPEGTSYPRDFDELGCDPGEYSYLAVIHADGNSMGDRFRNLSNGNTLSSSEYAEMLTNFSGDLAKATQTALKATIEKFSKTKDTKTTDRRLFLRPLVIGGDDVTIVCDGRFGLAVAIDYLRQFQSATANLPDKKGSATASAGVAIVKTHYPFARAYELANELCKSAKKHLHHTGSTASGLDWHFAQGGLYGDLKTIREREYGPTWLDGEKITGGYLTLRPVTLDDSENIHTWATIARSIETFQGKGNSPTAKAWARNKQKALRDALRRGPDAVQRFCEIYRQHLDVEGGWYHQNGENYCAYFDALELVDWYKPLEGG